MSNKVVVPMLGVLLCCGGMAQATNIDFYTYGTIGFSDEFYNVNLYSNAAVNMTGGRIAHTAFLHDSAVLNVYDGSIWGIEVGDSSVLNLWGGEISAMWLMNTTVNIYGYGISLTPELGNTVVQGYWGDGTPFNFTAYRSEAYNSQFVIHTPEPATIAFLAIGILAIKKFKHTNIL
jgi:hypothetical protein